MEPIRRALLEKALAFYRRFLGERSRDPSVRLEAGRAAQRAGHINWMLGRHAEAEQSLRESIALLERMATDIPDEPDTQIELSKSHTRLASVYTDTGRITDAMHQYGRAKERLEQLAVKRPGWESLRRELVHAHLNSGGVLVRQRGRLQEGEQDLHRALEIAEGLTREFPGVPDYPNGAAGALSNLAYGASQRRDWKGGLELLQRALPLAKRALDADPQNLGYLSFFLNISQGRAITLMNLGELKAAKEAMQQVLPARERQVADFPSVPGYRRNLAHSIMVMGNIMGRAGDRRGEEESYRRALKLLEDLVDDFPALPGHRLDLARCLTELSGLIMAQDRLPEAIELSQRAVAMAPQDQYGWPVLGMARYRSGNWKGAVEALEKANQVGPVETLDPGANLYMAMALWQLGERDRAREWYDKAVARRVKTKSEPERLLRLHTEAAALLGRAGATSTEPKDRSQSN